MQLVLLDYAWGTVKIIKNVPDNIKNLEVFVRNILHYKDSEVSYILLEDDDVPVFYTYNELEQKVTYDNENLLNNG